MAYRSNNRRGFGAGNNYGGSAQVGRNMNPWDNQNTGGGNYGNVRNQGGQGQGMNAEALTLANNLLNNLLRNQNPPSLLDLPRGGSGGNSLSGRGPRQVGNRGVNNRNRRGPGFNRNQKSNTNNKGGGIRKQNAFDRAKKLLAKNSKPKKESGDNKDKKKNESPKESIYADVPNDMFYCHLCKKDMWDSTSFENHIKGRTHMMMREGIEESYRLKANMIRQEAKIAEQLKMIELDRLKRMGKSKAGGPREYCTMCDLNFHGHLSAHRKSEGHLALKKFLHPKCTECNKEFPTRIEYDTHLLLPEHLKKAAESNSKLSSKKKKNNLNILTEEDELKDVKPPAKKKKKAAEKKEGEAAAEGEEKKENGEGAEGEEKKEGEEATEEKEGEEEEDANATLVEDPEDCILDYNDGDEVPTEVEAKLPKYNWQRAVGTSLISKLECYECFVCGKFFDTEKTTEVHSRTVTHHRCFVKFINDKASETRIAQKRAAAALEESERKKKKLEAAENGDKTEAEKAEGELYDPTEATGEDEDVEMNENPEEDQEQEAVEEGDAEVEDEDDKKEEEVNGKEDEEEEEVKDEPMEEDEPKKEEEEKVEADQKKAEPATPKAVTPAKGTSPAQKATPAAARAGAPAKGTPRGRGRGRYNRY